MRAAKKTPLFQHWLTTTDRFCGTGPESPSAKVDAAHRKCLSAAALSSPGPESFMMALAHISAEREWHNYGRPYFKVHSQAGHWLANTAMNFSAEHFAVPFDVFSIMLPPREFGRAGTFIVAVSDKVPDPESQVEFFERHRDLADPYGKGICSAVADYCRDERAELDEMERQFGRPKLQFCFSWLDSDAGNAHTHMVVYERMTLEDALTFLDNQSSSGADILSPHLAWEHRKPMIRVAVGVAMFAVNKHEMVSPDVSIEQLRSRFPGGRSRGSQLLAQQSIARELKKCRGWTIGQELDLPRPEYHRADGSHADGRELEFSHVRSGHMKMQPHGPANSLRKLIFVAPTVVRKDLPIQPHRGFQIRDNVVPATAETTTIGQ